MPLSAGIAWKNRLNASSPPALVWSRWFALSLSVAVWRDNRRVGCRYSDRVGPEPVISISSSVTTPSRIRYERTSAGPSSAPVSATDTSR